MSKNYTIREYGCIWCGEGISTIDDIFLTESSFKMLENWILETEAESLLSFGKKNGRAFFKVKNYVGIIELKDGTQIEILPKIAQEANITSSQNALLKMLQYTHHLSFKYYQKAQIQVENISILEIFITTFLEELQVLLQKGLKSDYTEIKDNQFFLKGKIQFKEQLQKNTLRQERFYVTFDEYIADIAPNRVIKTTLLFLEKATRNQQNKQKIKKYQSFLSDIPACKNLKQDLEACKHLNRFFSHYTLVLEWCKIFLQDKSFTSFSGSSINWAILFPMEKVFESYIGKIFYKYTPECYNLTLQDKKHFLLETPKQFSLIPDMVLYENDKAICLLDTKWKRLDFTRQDFGILQADLYQMFVYAKKYGTKKVILIYPEIEENSPQITYWKYDSSLEIGIVLFPVCKLNLFHFEIEKVFVEQILLF